LTIEIIAVVVILAILGMLCVALEDSLSAAEDIEEGDEYETNNDYNFDEFDETQGPR
jgi:hypothetical protein